MHLFEIHKLRPLLPDTTKNAGQEYDAHEQGKAADYRQQQVGTVGERSHAGAVGQCRCQDKDPVKPVDGGEDLALFAELRT